MVLYEYVIDGVAHVIPDNGQGDDNAEAEAKSKYGDKGRLEVGFRATKTKGGRTAHKTFQEGGHRTGK